MVDAMSPQPRSEMDPEPEPLPRRDTTVGDQRMALGLALQDRAADIGTLIDRQFGIELKGRAFDTARLGAELIGHWLATDQVASAGDEAALSHQRDLALVQDTGLATVTKAYFAWRDITTAVLIEEGRRLKVDHGVVTLAIDIVRFSCDGSLIRLVHQFDEARRAVQARLEEEQASLAHQALHDQLTGLPNRSLLADRVQQSVEVQSRRPNGAMLLSLDLDNFKAINDRFGRSAGDCLLTTVATRLQELVRAGDTVARLGGDEFAILADDLDDPEAAARSLAERAHLVMRAPVSVGERQLHTSMSIGIAPVGPGSDPETCLAQADAAMERAKRGGPARLESYRPELGEDTRRASQLAHELRMAHERGQLAVHYQPLFRPGGALVGMEALLRWRHPSLDEVTPDEFIPLLERSREIVPVGRWVLFEAARQCRAWQAHHPELSVSVNVSVRQLQDPDLVDDVRHALAQSELAPGALVLEVTEAALAVDMVRIGMVMERVRELGVHLALDDFGTGYSSLLRLKGLPIDRLKIDRSFVSGLGSPGHDATVIATVVDLAHKLGLAVVAEGVETEEELRAVSAMGCDEVQGFLLARPGPAGDFDPRPPASGPAAAPGRSMVGPRSVTGSG
jgi:diguanylate cyclase (GGDEF)-like protein